MKDTVAIIGGGIAGLTAAYLLNEKYDITLFEKNGRLGGNAHTYRTHDGIDVDIAVAAFGLAGYKNFYRLLDELKVKTSLCATSYMSMRDLDTGRGIYLTPLSLEGILAQRFAMFAPKQMKTMADLLLGIRHAKKLLDRGALDGITLREAFGKFPRLRGDARLLMMFALCLLSSMYYEEVMESPARFFIEKLKVHNDVISPRAVYSVRAVTNKTRSYVEALASRFSDRVVLNAKIKTVQRGPGGVTLVLQGGKKQRYGSVIFACPADDALSLIEKPTPQERQILGAWRYKRGTIVVHRDHASFPRKELIQAYTFLYTDRKGKVQTSVNGGLWHEPGVPADCDYISSQHPNFPIRKDLIEYETAFKTPIFDFNSCPTIGRLPSLNGVNRSYFCGSHFGYGLHNDAVTSAIAAARGLGVEWGRR